MNYRPQSEVSMFIWREIVDYYGLKLSIFFAVDDLFSTGRKDDFALAKIRDPPMPSCLLLESIIQQSVS
jgi:hypothetical protein